MSLLYKALSNLERRKARDLPSQPDCLVDDGSLPKDSQVVGGEDDGLSSHTLQLAPLVRRRTHQRVSTRLIPVVFILTLLSAAVWWGPGVVVRYSSTVGLDGILTAVPLVGTLAALVGLEPSPQTGKSLAKSVSTNPFSATYPNEPARKAVLHNGPGTTAGNIPMAPGTMAPGTMAPGTMAPGTMATGTGGSVTAFAKTTPSARQTVPVPAASDYPSVPEKPTLRIRAQAPVVVAPHPEPVVETSARPTKPSPKPSPLESKPTAAAKQAVESAQTAFDRAGALPEQKPVANKRDRPISSHSASPQRVSDRTIPDPPATAERSNTGVLFTKKRGRTALQGAKRNQPRQKKVGDPMARALLRARAALAVGDLDAAGKILSKIPRNPGNRVEHLSTLAAWHSKKKAHEQAARLYRQLIILEPEQGRWWLGLAISLDRLGNLGSAAFAYQQAAGSRNLQGSVQQFVRSRLQELYQSDERQY